MTLILALAWLSACTTIPPGVATLDGVQAIPELNSVPFYPQKRFQCGPAALTTLLTYSEADVTLAAITDATYIPGRQGSLQVELLSAARNSGRVPYKVDGRLSALAAELRAGRPVLVLQNLGVKWYPRWHFAVVVGIDVAADSVILRSGTDRRRRTGITNFLRTWQRSDFWAVVVLRPGEMPADPDRGRYLEAVADLEAVGLYPAAHAGWQGALSAWPRDRVAMFGVASTLYQMGQFVESEHQYRAVLDQYPNLYAARNNLAYAIAEQGRYDEAIAELNNLLTLIDSDEPQYSEYQASLRELMNRRGAAD